MIWDGTRTVAVRMGHAEVFNALAPAPLEISPAEAAKRGAK